MQGMAVTDLPELAYSHFLRPPTDLPDLAYSHFLRPPL